MLYLKAMFVGVIAALVGAVLTVVVPLCVQLIRLRWQTRGELAGTGAVSFVLGFGFAIALFVVVGVCFVSGFWWVVSRNT
jgi:hypothetical protein